MSTRTIIEINHDFWHELEANPAEAMKTLLRSINTFNVHDPSVAPPHGVRLLAQRHHTEVLKLEVKS
jgi:hypothetical protein